MLFFFFRRDIYKYQRPRGGKSSCEQLTETRDIRQFNFFHGEAMRERYWGGAVDIRVRKLQILLRVGFLVRDEIRVLDSRHAS